MRTFAQGAAWRIVAVRRAPGTETRIMNVADCWFHIHAILLHVWSKSSGKSRKYAVDCVGSANILLRMREKRALFSWLRRGARRGEGSGVNRKGSYDITRGKQQLKEICSCHIRPFSKTMHHWCVRPKPIAFEKCLKKFPLLARKLQRIEREKKKRKTDSQPLSIHNYLRYYTRVRNKKIFYFKTQKFKVGEKNNWKNELYRNRKEGNGG